MDVQFRLRRSRSAAGGTWIQVFSVGEQAKALTGVTSIQPLSDSSLDLGFGFGSVETQNLVFRGQAEMALDSDGGVEAFQEIHYQPDIFIVGEKPERVYRAPSP